ncbi:unnamed protein product [Pleuronectes platessa]|uniref:Uncharacterized protein n=1 Tax=Pleuronectes platessa TaxID=8262 RepID=A0A9N7TJM6_PLEPL|nr:unnamed protein product [Pleuronectes platessa]
MRPLSRKPNAPDHDTDIRRSPAGATPSGTASFIAVRSHRGEVVVLVGRGVVQEEGRRGEDVLQRKANGGDGERQAR